MTVVVEPGQMVNPDIVQAQIMSSVVYGMSAALNNEITLDKGRVLQTNFSDYTVLRMHETPVIDIVLVRSTENPGGVGEPATALVAPALANALFEDTGKRVRTLPLHANLLKA